MARMECGASYTVRTPNSAWVSRSGRCAGQMSRVVRTVEVNLGGHACARFDLLERWPELLEQLDSTQLERVKRVLANGWLDVWEPDREAVENFVEYARGAITVEESLRRARERAQQRGNV